MEKENQTSVSGFLLLGLSNRAEQRRVLFVLFLWIYLLRVLGSLLIVLAIGSDPHLHTPVYFFLTNLSLADICLLSTIVPKMLVGIQTQDKSISYVGCLTQIYFFAFLIGLDQFLLIGMAYDRYLAVCHPLRDTTIMSPRRCALVVAGAWIVTSLHALTHTLLVDRLSFCSSLEILQFYCDFYQVLRLSCSDIFINEVGIFVAAIGLVIIPLTGLLFSYARIVSTRLTVPSAKGRYKAFSTCGSHLSGVSLFYSTSHGTYLCPTSNQTSRLGSIASVMYTLVTPMLNPFIYSLRNKDMKGALKKLVSRERIFT
ncbi:olfactory receptor 7D4-like [Tachyglossus aculeatus]|uniref:olfactory receptor 7D4-like n=1 Tax=Tachyglossus aculeatus TaxID=9261 RepID=UPI0018F44D01|nr:olfactory receptor 7D4-like [Tachyglossus aculeatus]